MIVVTTLDISGRRITRTLGMVRGNTIRARHIGRDIMAIFRNIAGGEVYEYTKMLAEAREQAIVVWWRTPKPWVLTPLWACGFRRP